LSGIAGIFERGGKPVDRELLRALTDFLSYRGPDALETWCEGAVGFGHAMLRTTRESQCERQPACLDGRFWIVADARIDCRADLIAKLEDAGRQFTAAVTDPDLILHAYAVWGEDCVQHLRGDFSFAVWDVCRKELFCARDHFGVKPFYYAEVGGALILSNTLNCVRMYPGVSDDLNDDAVLDFLLIGLNCDNSSTTFKAVRRLPPAHSLRASADGVRVSPYWLLPTDGRIRYRREEDYIEHFNSVLQEAVADRLRADRVGIFLSGGLDSPTIAATVRRIAPAVDLRAYTFVYESLIPDQEGKFARQVADFLHIPIQLVPLDGPKPFDSARDSERAWPEPIEDPCLTANFDEFRLVASDRRVVLSGQGCDDIMDFQMWPYAKDLARRHEWRQFVRDGTQFLRVRRFPWLGLLRRVQKLFGKGLLAPLIPDWIAPRWAGTTDFTKRWATRTAFPDRPVHPVCPRAHAALSQPQWAVLFENEDPGFTRVPVEVRYPFLDLRVVEYLLALPPFPCFFKKTLLRQAMAAHLPREILTRPKTSLAGDPVVAVLKRGAVLPIVRFQWSEAMNRYVNRSKLSFPGAQMCSERARVESRPYCLNFWLQVARTSRYNLGQPYLPMEARNGCAQDASA
jgi:asparagine synthase (glutamine-hydrolysing)